MHFFSCLFEYFIHLIILIKIILQSFFILQNDFNQSLFQEFFIALKTNSIFIHLYPLLAILYSKKSSFLSKVYQSILYFMNLVKTLPFAQCLIVFQCFDIYFFDLSESKFLHLNDQYFNCCFVY